MGDYDTTTETSTKVYPFTEAHIEVLLGRNATAEVPWLKDVKDIPFYHLGLEKNVVTWEDNKDDGADYAGNESRPERQDSIYLSYALVVLPGESEEGQ